MTMGHTIKYFWSSGNDSAIDITYHFSSGFDPLFKDNAFSDFSFLPRIGETIKVKNLSNISTLLAGQYDLKKLQWELYKTVTFKIKDIVYYIDYKDPYRNWIACVYLEITKIGDTCVVDNKKT